MPTGLTSEDQLCLLLARGRLTQDEQARARQILASPLQWPLLLERAYSHQVYPLVHRNLRVLESSAVPDAVQAELKGAFLANALRNQLLAEELARLLGLLREAGILVIPLKGVTLAKSLYGDVASRVCADIDVLVPRNDVLRARRVILASGYTSFFTEEFFVNHQFDTTADCSLFKEKAVVPYMLEVHWTLLQHSSKDNDAMAELWSQARPEDFFGIQACNLTPEWQFLYLSVHAAYHKWTMLKWLADIHELCISESVDWVQVKDKAARFDLEPVAETTITVCSSLFGTPVPARLSPRPLPADVRLFPESLADSESWNAQLFYPRLLKRPSEKLRWFAQMFFVARIADRRFLDLPPSLSFIYYFLRPLRLTCKWSWRFLRAGVFRLTGNRQAPLDR
jgi:Uncharacterised nucleotidyltransferase